jgi:hypothetical protein
MVQPAPSPSALNVEANTPEWRAWANEKLDSMGRGSRADLVRHLKTKHPRFSTGQLTEILGPDEKPGQRRYTQYKGEIDAFLKPKLMPLSRDTHELQYLLEGLASADLDLLRQIRDMSSDEQRALAQMIAAMRKPK